MLLQTIYYPFVMYAVRRDGSALLPKVLGPGYESKSYGYVNTIDTSAILGDGQLHVFVTNRSLNEAAPVVVEPGGLYLKAVQAADVVTGSGPKAQNTFEQPDVIRARAFKAVEMRDGKAQLTLPPLSVTAVTFTF